MKLVKKLLIIGAVAVALAFIGMYAAVKIFLPPEKVKSLVHEHGSRVLGRDVVVNDASVGVFPTIRITVSGISLANGKGFSEDPMFNLKEIVLAVDFMSLFRMSPVIKEIRIVEADILYEVKKNGKTNLDGLGGEPKQKSEEETEEVKAEEPAGELKIPGALALKSFAIENARVRYRDMKSGQVITLGEINQKVSLEVDPNLEAVKTQGELVISSISVSDKKSGMRKGGVKVSFAHDLEVNLAEQKLSINNVKLGLQDILIEVMGKVNNFMDSIPSVDLKIASNQIKMASVLKEVPANLSPDVPKLSAKGYAEFSASVIGALDPAGIPNADFKLELNNIAFAHKDLPAGLNDLNGKILVTPDRFEIKDFGFKMDKHPVSVEVLLTNLLKIPNLKKLKVNSKVDLKALAELADKFVGLPEGFAMSGMVVSKIKAKGKLDPKNPLGIEAEGKVKLKKVRLESQELPEKLMLDGMLTINNNKMTETLDVNFGESNMSVKGIVKNYLAMVLPELAGENSTKVKVDVTSNYLDLDKILPTPSGEVEEEVQEEPVEPINAFPALPNVDMDIKVTLKKTKLMDLELTKYNQNTTIKNGVVSMNQKGTLYSGSFSNALSISLKDTTNAKVGMKLKLNKVEANDFISRINDKLPMKNQIVKSLAGTDNTIYGKLTMDMDVNTSGLPHTFVDNLTGMIYVKLFRGRLVGVKMVQGVNGAIEKVQKKVKVGKKFNMSDFTFNKLDITLEAKDGKLLVRDCKIGSTPAGAFDLSGSVDFDSKLDLALENHLSKSLSKNILAGQRKAQKAMGGAAGKLGKVGKAAGSLAAGAAVIPEDKQGRAVAYYKMTGTVSDPSIAVDFKRMAKEAAGGSADAARDLLNNAKKELEDKARKELEKGKAKVMKKKKELEDAAKAKVEAAKAKAEAEKAKLEAKKKAAEKKAKKEADKKKAKAKGKAKSESKKALKKFGF